MDDSLQPGFPDDAALLEAYRERGDCAALERLVEKYRAPLFSFIFRYVQGVHEAEDCFQETWARVLPRLSRKRAEREIAERHAAALRTLEAIRRRVLDAEARQAEDADREVDALLSGKEGFPPRGPDAHFGFCRRAPRPKAGDAPAAPSGPAR